MTRINAPLNRRRLAAVSILALSLGLSACAGGMSHDRMAAGHAMDQTVDVGGSAMYPSKTIVANAVNSADHTTLVAAVKAAGLVDALSTPGPFTVFAPTNAAFDALPAGTVDALLEPQNKPMLTGVLTYHVVPGRLDRNDLMARIRDGGGGARLTTLSGGTLTAMMNGPRNIVIKDAHGQIADISTYDVMQSNGVIHVVDHVLLPQG